MHDLGSAQRTKRVCSSVVWRAYLFCSNFPEDVIAEIHHKVEPRGHKYYQYAALWEAPVVVTTAVSFFETLAGHTTRSLRKLHQLPGSAVIVDESHASTPYHLYPQNEQWMKELSEQWGCHFLYASGSLIQCFDSQSIIPAQLSQQMKQSESKRVTFERIQKTVGLSELLKLIETTAGPRLVILNTVHNAAVIAKVLAENKREVLHLSTALTPADQTKTLERVRARLQNKRENENDRDWTLVATSCVEAGVDISFHNAIRELCSVASLLQVAGRVNRHGEYETGKVYSVALSGSEFNSHPDFIASRFVLNQLWDSGWIDKYQGGEVAASELVTEAYKRECGLTGVQAASKRIMDAENNQAWADLGYAVIDSAAQTVIIDPTIADRVQNGIHVPFTMLMRNSVHIWPNMLSKAIVAEQAKEIEESGLYRWTGEYNNFLGYMAAATF